jgi:hypothetical protein
MCCPPEALLGKANPKKILEKATVNIGDWNGAKLTQFLKRMVEFADHIGDTRTMLEWAKSMTWKGVHPVVELSRTVYEKGITVAKDAMQAVESRLECQDRLPRLFDAVGRVPGQFALRVQRHSWVITSAV